MLVFDDDVANVDGFLVMLALWPLTFKSRTSDGFSRSISAYVLYSTCTFPGDVTFCDAILVRLAFSDLSLPTFSLFQGFDLG